MKQRAVAGAADGLHARADTEPSIGIDSAHGRGRGSPGGWWIPVEPEVHFVTDQAVAVPDLPGWRRTRMPRIPQGHRFEVVPSRFCEILSPAAANREGLPAPDALEQILRKRLLALRLARLDAARRRLAQAPAPPMTAEEIQAEIDAYRAEQPPPGRNRLSRIPFALRLVSAQIARP